MGKVALRCRYGGCVQTDRAREGGGRGWGEAPHTCEHGGVEDTRTPRLLLGSSPVQEHHEPFPFMVVNSLRLLKPPIERVPHSLCWTSKPQVSFIDRGLQASTRCSHLSRPEQQRVIGSRGFLPGTFCPAYSLVLDPSGKGSVRFLLKGKDVFQAWLSGGVCQVCGRPWVPSWRNKKRKQVAW